MAAFSLAHFSNNERCTWSPICSYIALLARTRGYNWTGEMGQCEWARALAYLCVFYWCSDIWIMPEQSKWDIGASSTYPRIHRNKKIKNTLKLKQSNTQLCRAIRYKDTRILFDFSGRWMGCKVLASMLALMDSHKFGVKFAQILRYLAIPQILIAIRDKLRECVCFCDTQKPSKSVA